MPDLLVLPGFRVWGGCGGGGGLGCRVQCSQGTVRPMTTLKIEKFAGRGTPPSWVQIAFASSWAGYVRAKQP